MQCSAENAAQRKKRLSSGSITASVDHPNVIEILDVGEDRGQQFIVLLWLFPQAEVELAVLTPVSKNGRAERPD